MTIEGLDRPGNSGIMRPWNPGMISGEILVKIVLSQGRCMKVSQAIRREKHLIRTLSQSHKTRNAGEGK